MEKRPIQGRLFGDPSSGDPPGPDVRGLDEGLRIGTSSFSNASWCGVFYPANARPGAFLAHYATKLSTVEIDSTFYGSPAPRMVDAWRERTPDGFVVSTKMPRVITHDRGLVGCAGDLSEFLSAIDRLGERQGPVLLQFAHVSRRRDPDEHASGRKFRSRLGPFLEQLPREQRFVVEVRNDAWVDEPLLDLLRRHGVALALTAYRTMPSIQALASRIDPITAGFGYVRFLGDHRGMDRLVSRAMKAGTRRSEWDAILVDRSDEMRAAIPILRKILRKTREVLVYFNNHYAGFAPGSIDRFAALWREIHGEGTK